MSAQAELLGDKSVTDPASGGIGAVVVIHGIGEQHPYETLGAFVQGLAREFGIGPGRLEHRLSSTNGSVRTAIRMALPRPVGRESVRALDFYEFHWAGMVRGGIRLPHVLAWLVQTALTPLRFWSQQAAVLLSPRSKEKTTRRRLLWIFLCEVARAILFPIVVGVIIAPFFYAASKPQALLAAWSALVGALGSARAMATFAGFLALLFFVFAALRGAWKLVRDARAGGTSENASIRWWACASLVTALLLLAVGSLVDHWLDLQAVLLLGAVLAALWTWPIALPVIATAFAVLLGRILVRYLGDVAIYTNANENSAHFQTRAEKATALVREICEGGAYTAVYIAGHSLGSVIAYDVVNRYIRDARAGAPPATAEEGLARLRGLLTFGSPLDAIYYFFRTDVGPREPVRAQILSSLHGFRKRSSGRVYGDLKLAPYEIPELPGLVWLNVWNRTDLVSRRLVFYEVNRQEHRLSGWNPLRAHLAYWTDQGFYRLISAWL